MEAFTYFLNSNIAVLTREDSAAVRTLSPQPGQKAARTAWMWSARLCRCKECHECRGPTRRLCGNCIS